jgi:hypothetical protein
MKELLLIIATLSLFLLSITNLKAQESEQKGVLRLNVISPGIEFENGRNTTVSIMGALSTYIAQEGDLQFRPGIEFMIRKYINFEKRESQGKNIKNFSGDFIGLNMSYFTDPINGTSFEDSILAGLVYGLSRTYNSSASILLLGGVGYLQENKKGFQGTYSGIGIIVGIRFGFAVIRDKT